MKELEQLTETYMIVMPALVAYSCLAIFWGLGLVWYLMYIADFNREQKIRKLPCPHCGMKRTQPVIKR